MRECVLQPIGWVRHFKWVQWPSLHPVPENQAVIAAGVEPDGTRSGIALDADGKIILSPTGGAPLPTGAATYAAQTDGSQRVGALGVDGSTLVSTSNPVPIVSRADDARTVLRASGPLTASYVASSTYTIPAGVKWVTFVMTYTRGGAAGSAAHQIEIGDGTDIGPAVLLGGTITVTAPNGARPAYLDEINPGPVPADASAIVYAIQWLVGGESTIRIKSKEVGNGGSPGTLQVAIKGKY